MEKIRINDRISYFPATEEPLSADIGIIQCGEELWIFDVGASGDAAASINELPGRKKVVLSHFHQDHVGNLEAVQFDALYGGAFTCRRLGRGTVVCDDIYPGGGIHLFPLPSSHAKGCVGLEYGEYAFLGDGLYCAAKDGQAVYNAGLLRETILVLETLHADWVMQSHGEPFVCPKAEALALLRDIYSRREKQAPYIYL